MIIPNTSYTIPFAITSGGEPVAADSTPTAVVWRNGSVEATSAPVSTTSNTGIYHAVFTTGAGWSRSDRIWLVVSAVIATKTYRSVVWWSFGEPDAVMRGTDSAYTGTPPTAAAIASQTRTELGTELARIDVATSTRLAATSYTAPPTATQNADAVFSSSESGPSTGNQWGSTTMGRRLLRSTNTDASVVVTGNGHVAATVHSMQDDSISAAAVSAGAVTKITTGVWSALTSGLNVVGSTGRAVARLIGLVEDSGGDRFTAKALEEGPASTGGDATEAKQDEIISLIQGSEVLTVATPNVRGNLVLTQGDTYDGVTGGNAKATWTVSTDYTDGWSVVLTIRDKDDAVVYTNSGTVVNATTITAAIATPTVSPFEGCPGVWQGKYDVQLSKSTSKKTIAIGTVYINEDQTRS